MKIISESNNVEFKEMLPQIMMRMYAVCKNDPSFHLKTQVVEVEKKVSVLNRQLEKKEELLQKSNEIHDDLKKRLDDIEQKNYELKSRLLDELGSEI